MTVRIYRHGWYFVLLFLRWFFITKNGPGQLRRLHGFQKRIYLVPPEGLVDMDSGKENHNRLIHYALKGMKGTRYSFG
jgi:hypothetical protein